jgi:hypothetical protein
VGGNEFGEDFKAWLTYIKLPSFLHELERGPAGVHIAFNACLPHSVKDGYSRHGRTSKQASKQASEQASKQASSI